MLLHGQLVVQMNAEIADDSGQFYGRRSYSKSRLLSLARFACDPNQIASVLLAFSCRRCDLHQVGVARLTIIMELSVIDIEV